MPRGIGPVLVLVGVGLVVVGVGSRPGTRELLEYISAHERELGFEARDPALTLADTISDDATRRRRVLDRWAALLDEQLTKESR
jgi:hypothetical protein